MAKKKKIKNIPEKVTENVNVLTDQELDSFISWMQERRLAIGQDVLQWLEIEEVEQIEAVIFNGLVDAYTLGTRQKMRYVFIGMPKCKKYVYCARNPKTLKSFITARTESLAKTVTASVAEVEREKETIGKQE